jgi:glycosyltransferase involved in cell wall biosynthesis
VRIAQVAPLHEAVPPKLYGGTERIVSYITEALVEQGHDVTLFASGDSVTTAKLHAAWPKALRLDPRVIDRFAPHFILLEQVHRLVNEFDLIHFHLDYLPFSLFSSIDVPYLTTLHGRLDIAELQQVFSSFPGAPVVSISDSQRQPLPSANWIDTVHNGIPADLLTPDYECKGEYLAFLGRISPEKGILQAIEIAKAARIPLRIAAKVDKYDQDFFEREVRQHIDGVSVIYIGEVNDRQKEEFLRGAKAVLFPVDWPEPFGLVMIEAMACGVPVVAFKRGSTVEVLDHGITGFLVDDVDGAISALQLIDELSKAEIRAQFERRFTAAAMAEKYCKAYEKLIRSRVAA